MQVWKLGLLLVCACSLASCGNSKRATTIYVIVPTEKKSQFSEDLATIAERHGLIAYASHLSNRLGDTTFVVEGEGGWLSLFSANVPLGGDENPACGQRPRPDPGQYYITVDYRGTMLGLNHLFATLRDGDEPKELIADIEKDLETGGYDVRQQPVLCSMLAR